ncbi:hypothetical protein [Planococcus faecalis]|nr:hypothetical protein [Planococcus faecalis]
MEIHVTCDDCKITGKFSSPQKNGEVGIHSITTGFQVGLVGKVK